MQLGPGRFQMMQQQVCDDCPNVKYVCFSSPDLAMLHHCLCVMAV